MSKPSDTLGTSLQRTLLTILVHDDKSAGVIRGAVPVELFEGDFYTVAHSVYWYHDQYKRAPCADIDDLLGDVTKPDARGKNRIAELLTQLHDTWDDGVNIKYAVDRLRAWSRQQQLKRAVVDAAKLLQGGNDDALDEVETVLNDAMRSRLSVFESGTRLSDNPTGWLDRVSAANSMPTGITSVDRLGLGPVRKGVHLMIGPPKSGKTQWLTNLGRRAATQGYRVVHVTMEMSEDRMAQRYYQSICAMPKRRMAIDIARVHTDDDGRVCGFDWDSITPSMALDDPDIVDRLELRSEQLHRTLSRIVIKEFPTGQLTVNQLAAYLDGLEASMDGYTPDLLIVDYADIMSIDISNYRLALGQIYVGLRGLAAQRNMAVATASQSNREGATAKRVNSTNVAEDWSKIATVDCVMTYSRTEVEKELGLARLYVANARNDADQFTVVISQSYATGQFVLDNAPMPVSYWEQLQALGGGTSTDTDDT